MITNHIALEKKTVEESPKYDDTTKMIRIEKAIIVKNGMENGLPSVDLQCVDADGNRYLVFTTGKIINAINIMAESAVE